MKAKLDNIVDRIRDWTDTAAEKAGTITRAAAAKAEELSKVGKLKMDIYQLRRELARLHADLGRITYQTLKGQAQGSIADQPGVEDLLGRISGLLDDISAKESDLEKVSQMEESVHEPPPGKKEDYLEKGAAEGKEASDTKPAEKAASAQKRRPPAKSAQEKKSVKKKPATTAKRTGPKKTGKAT